MMRILGIDPGTSRIGVGIVEYSHSEYKHIFHDLITPSGADSGNTLVQISDAVRGLMEKYRPDRVGLEKLFFSKNVTTALSVAEARGVIKKLVSEYGIPLVEVAPNEVKLALTGRGNATKNEVAGMVSKFLDIDTDELIDDTTDALAVAITASSQSSIPDN